MGWERHFLSECTRAAPVKKGPKRCPVVGCKEQLGPSNRFECTRCGTTVCLKHRLQEDHPCNPGGGATGSSNRAGSAPPASRRGSPPASAGMSADERLARELQQQELDGAQARGDAVPPGARPKKKSMSSRIIGMFACFKQTSQSRTRLINGGSSSSRS